MIQDAKWIRANCECPTFQKKLFIKKNVESARLYITAMGVYECSIDGHRIGNFYMAPGWTNYNDHIQYQEYDITYLLHNGSVLEVMCGNGWAVSRMGLDEETSAYADHISCIFSVEIRYSDGEEDRIISDEEVGVYSSEVIKTDIYNGEVIDRTREKKHMGYAAADNISAELIPQIGENVCEQEIIRPARIIVTPKGERVVDFGQNMTGYVKIKVCGKRGDVLKIRHGEVLDSEGNFYCENLRSARQEAVYVMGKEYEVFKPHFTFYGFRYICVDEFPGEVDIDNFEAVELHSDMRRTSSFVCGHEGLNRLYSNIIWGQKDNFLDIPTDCPQRDERLGWTGDVQVFVRTAAINFNVEKFFTKWLCDLRCEQKPDGAIPAVIPDCVRAQPQPVSAAWADVAVVCPWEIYRAYANKQVLSDNYSCMQKWVEYIHNAGDEEFLWLGGSHFGDWLGLDAKSGDYVGATDKDLIASCFFAHTTDILISAGEILGKDMSYYRELSGNIRAAIEKRFMKDGLPICKTQTACALLLYFDLCRNKKPVAELLKKLVESNGNKLTTGFVGTPYLLHALSENGYAKTAYDLLLQTEYPSWLYAVNHGATTMWEHWDGIREDGSFWSSDMNSFNHYAYGSVFDWIFSVAAGININKNGAGYSDITIKPNPDARVGFMDISIETGYGKIRSMWRYFEDFIRYEIEIPMGISAWTVLPDGRKYECSAGKHIFYSECL